MTGLWLEDSCSGPLPYLPCVFIIELSRMGSNFKLIFFHVILSNFLLSFTSLVLSLPLATKTESVQVQPDHWRDQRLLYRPDGHNPRSELDQSASGKSSTFIRAPCEANKLPKKYQDRTVILMSVAFSSLNYVVYIPELVMVICSSLKH